MAVACFILKPLKLTGDMKRRITIQIMLSRILPKNRTWSDTLIIVEICNINILLLGIEVVVPSRKMSGTEPWINILDNMLAIWTFCSPLVCMKLFLEGPLPICYFSTALATLYHKPFVYDTPRYFLIDNVHSICWVRHTIDQNIFLQIYMQLHKN